MVKGKYFHFKIKGESKKRKTRIKSFECENFLYFMIKITDETGWPYMIHHALGRVWELLHHNKTKENYS